MLFSFWRFIVRDLLLLFDDCLEGLGVGECFLFSVMVRERLGGVWARFDLPCCAADLSNILYMYHPFAPKSWDFVACFVRYKGERFSNLSVIGS